MILVQCTFLFWASSIFGSELWLLLQYLVAEYWHLLGTRSGMHLPSTAQSQVRFTLFLFDSSSSSELERMNLVGFPKRFLGREVSVKHSSLLSLLLLSVLGYFCPHQCIHLQDRKQIGESSIAVFGHLKILCQLISQRLTNQNSFWPIEAWPSTPSNH